MEAELSLLDAAKGMDKKALITIFDRYAPELYNYALRLCRDPLQADHIVGDVFTKFLEQLVAGKGPRTSLRSYLYKMTYHLIVDGSRASKREAPLELADFERDNGHHSMVTNLENQILMESVVLAIKNDLTVDQRNVIILRFVNGFSLLETAEILGKEIDNIKVIQNRAIAKLRKAVDHKANS